MRDLRQRDHESQAGVRDFRQVTIKAALACETSAKFTMKAELACETSGKWTMKVELACEAFAIPANASQPRHSESTSPKLPRGPCDNFRGQGPRAGFSGKSGPPVRLRFLY